MNCRLPVAVSPVLAAVLLVTVSPNVFDIEVCSMTEALQGRVLRKVHCSEGFWRQIIATYKRPGPPGKPRRS